MSKTIFVQRGHNGEGHGTPFKIVIKDRGEDTYKDVLDVINEAVEKFKFGKNCCPVAELDGKLLECTKLLSQIEDRSIILIRF